MKTTLALAFVLTILTGSAVAAAASVSGTYRAEGKDTKLSFVRVAKGTRPYSDDPAILFAFTEKDASDAKDLSSDVIAFSHKYGSAITMNIFKNSDGVYEVDESAFHHSGSDKAGGNASGILQLKDVTVANGNISGEVYTKPDTDMFGAKVDIDLKFKAAMPK
ncbi:MAG: hypothetical protein ABIQ70_08740 [Dokdonella sp.]